MATLALAIGAGGRLHSRVTAQLARRVIESDRRGKIIAFPKEADLCGELGISRSILRESMKVLADKGMVEMKPRAGTHSRPREEWNRLDADILGWQAALGPDPQFVRELCEVRLAIEPTAAGFAAVRATEQELAQIEECLEQRREAAGHADLKGLIELDMALQSAVVDASRNALLRHLCASIRGPFQAALAVTVQVPATVKLGLEAHEVLLDCLRKRDPLGARRAAEDVVGLAMLAVESGLRRLPKAGRSKAANKEKR
jgi:GntR family galactonate operon transcriptional repressor